MSEPIRFSLKHHGQLSCVEHCPEGEYVLHSDYARLKAEVEELTGLLKASTYYNTSDEVTRLKAEVERLTKELENTDCMFAMASAFARDWLAAKEGKQP